jgi:septal ring factor EnvC (AmiA/AmiB activator)
VLHVPQRLVPSWIGFPFAVASQSVHPHVQAMPAQPILGHAQDDQLQHLRETVATKESMITANQTRISKLESLHKLAQESAMKCETELISCHKALSKTKAENEKLAAEAQQSRLTSTCIHGL